VTIVARSALVLVIAVVLQTSLVQDLRVFGASADLMVLIAIAAGLAGGADRGAAYGFAAGLIYDLLLTTPLGLSALTYCLIGYGVGAMQGSVIRSTRWIPIVAATVASAAGVILYVMLGEVVGQEFSISGLHRIALVVAIVNGALVLVAIRVVRWAMGGTHAQVAVAFR
jgi:rod shape-determining protein MreD